MLEVLAENNRQTLAANNENIILAITAKNSELIRKSIIITKKYAVLKEL